MLTCSLSDTSEVTGYDWVREVQAEGGAQSMVVLQRGRFLRVSNVSEAAWTCRFYGKEGILGNVTYDVPQMSKFSSLKTLYIMIVMAIYLKSVGTGKRLRLPHLR